jgi:Flp pilus assembly protein TadB
LRQRISDRAAHHKSEEHARLVRDITHGHIDSQQIMKSMNLHPKVGTDMKKELVRELREKTLNKRAHRKQRLKSLIEKSGIETSVEKIKSILLKVSFSITLICIALFNVFLYGKYGFHLSQMTIFSVIILILGLPLFYMVTWLLFYVYMDMLIFRRKIDIENVLPDFLELTSTNIRAGMPIDKALWFAVRPRFGVLAREIEIVAKQTFTGKDLEGALQDFAKKYDSRTAERAVSLLIEGLKAGGEIGELLDRIASNIQEIKLMKKEMAANVMTYVIFISFATVMGAPFLFGLSYQLVAIIQNITSMMNVPASGGAVPFTISGNVVKLTDFRIFAIVSLTITSIFSGMIVATIKKGNVREGIRYIPAFIFTTVPLYLLMSALFSILIGGFF